MQVQPAVENGPKKRDKAHIQMLVWNGKVAKDAAEAIPTFQGLKIRRGQDHTWHKTQHDI